MKSGYYLATVINAYRRAMDGEDFKTCLSELSNVAHREYTEAYADGKNNQTVNYLDSQSKGEYTYVADVLGYENGFVTVEMRNRFFAGERLEILSPTENFSKSFKAEEIIGADGSLVEDAKLVQGIYKIKCPYAVGKGDFLRRKNVVAERTEI